MAPGVPAAFFTGALLLVLLAPFMKALAARTQLEFFGTGLLVLCLSIAGVLGIVGALGLVLT